MNLCQYSDTLGSPGKGIHSYRLLDIAIVDVILTMIGAWLLSCFFGGSYIQWLLILFLTGIILHRLFCVRTTVDKWLFP